MDKPRVVWLYPKLSSWMGGPRFVFEVAKRMTRDYEVVVVSQQLTDDVRDAYVAEGIEVIHFDTPTFTDVKFWAKFPKSIRANSQRLRELIRPGDLIVSSMFPMHCFAAEAGLPFVQIAYEPFAMMFDRNFQAEQRLFMRLFCRTVALAFGRADIKAVGKAAALLTLSDFERRNCLSVYGRDSSIIFEGADTDFFKPTHNSELAARYAGRQVLFHSTGFDAFKGTAALIEAIPELVRLRPETTILISQTRADDYAVANYKQFLADKGVSRNVEFLGFLDYERLPEYYTLASLYLEPGVGRSMSLSSKEANACGTASVRGVVGTEDTINGETGILVDPGNPPSMAAAIAALLGDARELARMGNLAQQVVLEKYTWEAVVDRIKPHLVAVPETYRPAK